MESAFKVFFPHWWASSPTSNNKHVHKLCGVRKPILWELGLVHTTMWKYGRLSLEFCANTHGAKVAPFHSNGPHFLCGGWLSFAFVWFPCTVDFSTHNHLDSYARQTLHGCTYESSPCLRVKHFSFKPILSWHHIEVSFLIFFFFFIIHV